MSHQATKTRSRNKERNRSTEGTEGAEEELENRKKMQMDEDQKDPQTHRIIGAAIEVHRYLGRAFLEMVYQEALTVELESAGIPFVREVALPIRYKNHTLPCSYRADFVCFEEIIVELKALDHLTGIEHSQVINYLKATGLHRGMLLNFGGPILEIKRFVFDAEPRQVSSSVISVSSVDRSAFSVGREDCSEVER